MVQLRKLDRVVIRFAGDSGDGMQLTGGRFTTESADYGNDVATLPDYPAEIRAPQGTLAGVSSFQLQFADHDILTPGDTVHVLVAMNPAALKSNLGDVQRGGLLIVDADEFTSRNLSRVGYTSNPLEDGSLDGYHLVALPLTTLAEKAVAEFKLGRRAAARTKNMFALGLVSWLYSRPLQVTEHWLSERFAADPRIRDANLAALRAGELYGENTEQFAVRYQVDPAPMPAGKYRQVSGNQATAYGLLAAAHRAGVPLFLGSYPITPASDLLHELSRRKDQGVFTFQAEDEIAGVGAALGASFGGALGVSTTSGPGFTLKQEMINLAVMTELPLVVVDVQRAGPSTGMPTKTEQADLLQALWGRNGESPVVVLAPASPADCFAMAFEAARIALQYRTPVVLLSDAFLANGAEPWLIPQVADLPTIDPGFATTPNATDAKGNPVFHPYVRDPETLVREWALPGTPGLEHRIGGLEKAAPAGNISTNPLNHERMVHQRADRVAAVVRDIPDVTPDDPDGQAQVLVVGWGSTYGPIAAAIRRIRASGRSIAQLHLRHLNPLPANVGEVLHRYPRIVVPEMNLGQLSLILRARFLVDARSFSQVRGLPLSVDDLTAALASEVDDLTPRVDASSRVNPTNSTAFAGQAQPVGQPRGRR